MGIFLYFVDEMEFMSEFLTRIKIVKFFSEKIMDG